VPLPASGPAVRPDQKVAAVLKQHPQLVDVFVAESSAFERLRNPVLRRTFARMVTVAQASRVGNVPLPRLLASLNRALGLDVNEEDFKDMAADSGSGGSQGAAPEWLKTGKVSSDLDVRDMQYRGEDPFAVIMDSARHTRTGEILRLRNTFEPMPLYQVLGQKGFVHWAEELGPQDWLISFYREQVVQIEKDISPPPHAHAPAPAAAPAPQGGPNAEQESLFAADSPPADDQADAVVTIELEDLTPPLPMQKVLEGLAPLAPGQLLLVHHRRSPAHLLSKLEEQGHRYRVWDMGPDRKEMLIRKAG
jgi:uncharacterized protein (DUF2249 family)